MKEWIFALLKYHQWSDINCARNVRVIVGYKKLFWLRKAKALTARKRVKICDRLVHGHLKTHGPSRNIHSRWVFTHRLKLNEASIKEKHHPNANSWQWTNTISQRLFGEGKNVASSSYFKNNIFIVNDKTINIMKVYVYVMQLLTHAQNKCWSKCYRWF